MPMPRSPSSLTPASTPHPRRSVAKLHSAAPLPSTCRQVCRLRAGRSWLATFAGCTLLAACTSTEDRAEGGDRSGMAGTSLGAAAGTWLGAAAGRSFGAAAGADETIPGGAGGSAAPSRFAAEAWFETLR
ncbi:MAG: hypothetical protein JW751_21380 [Polyangiaceae bacterium]|nr:hypothetical protein [Polyangiaceae bacterium]